MSQKNYKPHYEHLKNKWQDKKTDLQKVVHEKHKESIDWFFKYLPAKHHIIAGSLGSMMLFSTPQMTPALHTTQATPENQAKTGIDASVFFTTDIAKVVPDTVRELTPQEEKDIGDFLSQWFGMKVSAELEGKRLNRSYGYIGQEQHLARFPGDTIANHFDTNEEAVKYSKYDMAPGLGAWGYFAPSHAMFTEKDNLREKYYIAVQTFLSPGYYENTYEMNQFFKYRKMLVVNPDNGKAIVVVIADAGPAEWTGKHLGGSPEVMDHLKRVDGKQKGPVLYYFIDDPTDSIPLGPVNVQ